MNNKPPGNEAAHLQDKKDSSNSIIRNAMDVSKSKYAVRDRESRNKKAGGTAFHSLGAGDPMQAITSQRQAGQNRTAGGLHDGSEYTAGNLALNQNKEQLLKTVKQQNQKLLQQQRMQDFKS